MTKRKRSPFWTKASMSVAICPRGLMPRNVRIAGIRTTCRFDGETWTALAEAARHEQVSIDYLCSTIAAEKADTLGLTAAIRSWLLTYFRQRARAR